MRYIKVKKLIDTTIKTVTWAIIAVPIVLTIVALFIPVLVYRPDSEFWEAIMTVNIITDTKVAELYYILLRFIGYRFLGL